MSATPTSETLAAAAAPTGETSVAAECPICCESFGENDHIDMTLACCGAHICNHCVCATVLRADTTVPRERPTCPTCRGEFVSGTDQIVVAFTRTLCACCNYPKVSSFAPCGTKDCAYYKKHPMTSVAPATVKRVHWVFSYTQPQPGSRRIQLSDPVLFSHRNGPTLPTSNYILRSDGGINHIHRDGSEQAWTVALAPQWFPLMASSLSMNSPCHPNFFS